MKERKYRNAARSNLSSDRLLKEILAILLLLLLEAHTAPLIRRCFLFLDMHIAAPLFLPPKRLGSHPEVLFSAL